MFDVFEGKPRQAVTATPVVISIVGHIVLVGLVVVIPLLYATDSLPKVPTMVAFVAAMPAAAPPPPPPPPPAGREARRTGTTQAAASERVRGADGGAAPRSDPSFRASPARLVRKAALKAVWSAASPAGSSAGSLPRHRRLLHLRHPRRPGGRFGSAATYRRPRW